MKIDVRLALACIITCTPLLAAAAAPEAPDPTTLVDVPVTGEQPAAVTGPGAPLSSEAPRLPVAATPPAAAAPKSATEALFTPDPDAYSAINAARGLSLHKPIYLYPATYSDDYRGSTTEVLFAISLKVRVYKLPLYFAYSQKSFFQAYNGGNSKPFRDNDFNPELFYRYIPADRVRWLHLGADAGIEHESNGQSLPGSRSWNRIYLAPFWAEDKTLVYWKWWYRIPENKGRARDDPKRDDNPDIQDYYGYSELHLQQQLFGDQAAHLMVRYNPARGRGAVNLQYSLPGPGSNFFWSAYVWNGYGESLLDYNRSITRFGLGVTLNR
ncbi:MAG: hypothetical protein NVS9B10_20670 [Nevskia sp.]